MIDASAAASVAALQGDTAVATADDETTVFALFEERRANLGAYRVRSVNQLHALMRDLVAGGARTALTARVALAALRSVRPATPTEHARKAMAWDPVRDTRSLDNQLVKIAEQMTAALEDYGSSLLEIDGIGPVLAVRLLGRAGRPSRFRSADAFASYTGSAPIEASSDRHDIRAIDRSRHHRRILQRARFPIPIRVGVHIGGGAQPSAHAPSAGRG